MSDRKTETLKMMENKQRVQINIGTLFYSAGAPTSQFTTLRHGQMDCVYENISVKMLFMLVVAPPQTQARRPC